MTYPTNFHVHNHIYQLEQRLYRESTLIDAEPKSVSFDGMGTSIEASYGDLSEAVAAYREAHRLRQSSGVVLFHLAVALGKFCYDILFCFKSLRLIRFNSLNNGKY